MLASIIIVGLAYLGLLIETDWMRVRLLVGKEIPRNKLKMTIAEWQRHDRIHPQEMELLRKEYKEKQLARVAKEQSDNRQAVEQSGRKWQFAKYGDASLLCCSNMFCHNSCPHQKSKGAKYAWRIPARTVKIFGSTINFKAGCNLYRAKLLKDIVKAQKSKSLPTYHHNGRQDANLDRLAQFELLVDGKAIMVKGNGNGDYKRGMVKEALKPYTTRAKVGKRTVTWDFGEADRVTAP